MIIKGQKAMRVLVDTCVWSAVLRRRNPDTELTARLKGLISDGRVFIIGPIRQEILSGNPPTPSNSIS